MWDTLKKAETWSSAVIGAAIEVHRIEGLMSYMKLLKKPLGLRFNFHELVLKNGIRRFVLKEAL